MFEHMHGLFCLKHVTIFQYIQFYLIENKKTTKSSKYFAGFKFYFINTSTKFSIIFI